MSSSASVFWKKLNDIFLFFIYCFFFCLQYMNSQPHLLPLFFDSKPPHFLYNSLNPPLSHLNPFPPFFWLPPSYLPPIFIQPPFLLESGLPFLPLDSPISLPLFPPSLSPSLSPLPLLLHPLYLNSCTCTHLILSPHVCLHLLLSRFMQQRCQ